ncbi:hypothetical protein C5167_013168, partial [Papaver somniferum]
VDKDEIINCYDIYKKPSLNHPSLHNHTIQMKPSMYPKNVKLNNLGTLQLTQTWHKYGSCPQGTIPIKRNRKDYRSTLLRKHHRLRFSHYKTPNTSHPNDIRDGHEHAIIKVDGNFLGAQTKINLWNFTDVRVLCTYPRMSPLVAISRISPLSKASKRMPHSDQNSGNWWVILQGIPVGYYPSSIFTQLSKKATRIDFGGEIFNTRSKGRHTITQMGSGHFPSEGGFGISSFFNHVQIDNEHANGYGFYYGGPGYNDNCQ